MAKGKYKFTLPTGEVPVGVPIPFSAEKLPVGTRAVQLAYTGRTAVFDVTDNDGGNRKTGKLSASIVLDENLPDGRSSLGTVQPITIWDFQTGKFLDGGYVDVSDE